MIFRFALFAVLAFAFASCTSTDFQTWEGGNSVVQGHGGTRKVVDSMDVWTHGDPPRRFKVLDIIEDERPGGMIPMAQLKHDIVQKARQSGGDAVIFVSSASQLAGYYTASSASAYGYGNSATAFGSSTTVNYKAQLNVRRYSISQLTQSNLWESQTGGRSCRRCRSWSYRGVFMSLWI
jgi:hypothetical protein